MRGSLPFCLLQIVNLIIEKLRQLKAVSAGLEEMDMLALTLPLCIAYYLMKTDLSSKYLTNILTVANFYEPE